MSKRIRQGDIERTQLSIAEMRRREVERLTSIRGIMADYQPADAKEKAHLERLHRQTDALIRRWGGHE